MHEKSIEPNILVVIPTYNECENIEPLVRLILHQQPNLHIMIVDDNSPDGTGEIADTLARQQERVQIFHRAKRMGYASAYKLGFEYALRYAYPYVLTMNADFSHNPRYIPYLVALARANDVAIGSRYVQGGGTVGANSAHVWLSGIANRAIRRLLALNPEDCTSRFRCYQTYLLPYIHYETVRADGLGFGVEILERCSRSGFRTAELPILYDYRLWPGSRSRYHWLQLSAELVWMRIARTKISQLAQPTVEKSSKLD
ncbi:MAG: glycosyltransferase [Chloroflexi bacterium]|nr:glycosyltransferase [Chloroflexota bacterium]